MKIWTNLARAAGLGLCVVALSGTALADPGKGNGNGPGETPPGQEKKAETTPAPTPASAPVTPAATPASKGQEKKVEKAEKAAAKPAAKPAAEPAAKPVAKAAKPAKAAPSSKGQEKKAEKGAAKATKQSSKPATSGSYKNTSSGTNEKKPEQTHKHTICHATGSASNPYVRITPSLSGVFNGHLGHQDGEDIVPPATYKGQSISQNWDAEGQAIFNAGCTVPRPTSPVTVIAPQKKDAEKKGECPTTQTTTERVIIGVWHATGAIKDGKRKYVFITPSLGSAHYDTSKHPDDIPVYGERTVSTTGSTDECKKVLVAQTPELPTPIVPTLAGKTPKPGTVGVLPAKKAAAKPVGGVAGAVSPAAVEKQEKEKDQGGVLGAVASAPEAIARTATSGTLPFTGIPLWIAALVGGGLLLAGVALRRQA